MPKISRMGKSDGTKAAMILGVVRSYLQILKMYFTRCPNFMANICWKNVECANCVLKNRLCPLYLNSSTPVESTATPSLADPTAPKSGSGDSDVAGLFFSRLDHMPREIKSAVVTDLLRIGEYNPKPLMRMQPGSQNYVHSRLHGKITSVHMLISL
jgi:hypothetical protein